MLNKLQNSYWQQHSSKAEMNKGVPFIDIYFTLDKRT